jgi:hypothetical protein
MFKRYIELLLAFRLSTSAPLRTGLNGAHRNVSAPTQVLVLWKSLAALAGESAINRAARQRLASPPPRSKSSGPEARSMLVANHQVLVGAALSARAGT